MDKKSSLIVCLVLVGAASPLLFVRSNDCYKEQTDCEKDWSAGDCKPNPQPANQCHYYGRSHYTFFRGASTSSNHSISTPSRGGFGGIGHGMFHGGG